MVDNLPEVELDTGAEESVLPAAIPSLGNASLTTECLVAATGIFIDRTPNDLERTKGDVRNYLARIRRRLTEFLGAKKTGPFKWKRPPSQKSLWASLVDRVELEEMDRWFDGWDGDQAVTVELMAVVNKAREYVRKAWPQYPDPTLGLHHFELAEDEYGDVWQTTRTLDDPETIFDDMDALVLLPDQVTAIATVYPALYKQICGLAMLLLQPYVTVGDMPAKKSLTAEREEQIRTLLQVPQDALISVEVEQPKPQQQKQPEQHQSNDTTQTQTPSEHIAQRRLLAR